MMVRKMYWVTLMDRSEELRQWLVIGSVPNVVDGLVM
jgi:hypothetical protein